MLIENSLLDPPPAEGPNPFETLRCWMIVVVCGVTGSCVLALTAVVFTIKTDNKIEEPYPVPTLFPIPYRFRLPDSFSLPPTDQKNIGTCWAFSTIYLLESQYRAQGVRQGLYSELDYTNFSVQAYLSFIHQKCKSNTSVKACHYGGILKDDPNDHQIESLYYWLSAWPELSRAIVPAAVCPYRNDKGGWFDCPNLDSALEKNPINWTVKSTASAFSVKAIKELLLKSKRVLGISVPLPDLIYYTPCNGSVFENLSVCLNRTYPCPEYVGEPGAHCYKTKLDARDQTGVFLANTEPKYMGELGGHGMNVVGYNDDWVYRNRFQSRQASAQLKGGFILHNSWREGGHSVEYLYGDESEENEAVICPNHVAPVNWIPANYSCVVQKVQAGGISATVDCPDVIQRIRGRGITKGADVLCNKSECGNTSTFYLLEQVEGEGGKRDVKHSFTASGLANVGLIVVNNQTKEVSRATLSDLPFWALSQIFTPVSLVQNDPQNCGYWMLPYATLENMQRINWDLLDNFRVVDLEIEFNESSYVRHPDSWDFDTIFLNASTYQRNKAIFDGPLPFEWIY